MSEATLPIDNTTKKSNPPSHLGGEEEGEDGPQVPSSGQVEATEGVRIKGFPTDAQLAQKVLSLPLPPLHGKPRTNIAPCKMAGQVIKVFLEEPSSSLLANLTLNKKGHVRKLLATDGTLYGDGATLYEYHRPVNQHCFVLRDKDEAPIALCIKDRPHARETSFNVYGRAPLHPGDAFHKQHEGAVEFFPWYRIKFYNAGNFEYHFVAMWDGKDYGQSILKIDYTTAPKGLLENVVNKDTAAVITLKSVTAAATTTVEPKADDADKETAEQQQAEAPPPPDIYAVMEHVTKGPTGAGWNLTVAPGVDPALVICAAPIIQDLVATHRAA